MLKLSCWAEILISSIEFPNGFSSSSPAKLVIYFKKSFFKNSLGMVTEVDRLLRTPWKRSIKWLRQRWLKTYSVQVCVRANFWLEGNLKNSWSLVDAKKNFYSLFRTIGHHQRSELEESRRVCSNIFLSRFLFFSIIITKNFTLVSTNGTVVVIDRNIYLLFLVWFSVFAFSLHKIFSLVDFVKLWKNVNIFWINIKAFDDWILLYVWHSPAWQHLVFNTRVIPLFVAACGTRWVKVIHPQEFWLKRPKETCNKRHLNHNGSLWLNLW